MRRRSRFRKQGGRAAELTHLCLQFNARGIVAMANSGPDTNKYVPPASGTTHTILTSLSRLGPSSSSLVRVLLRDDIQADVNPRRRQAASS